MSFAFDADGHIPMDKLEFYEAARSSPRELVNNALLRMTPKVFEKYGDHCDFLNEFAKRIQVHPRAVVVRGSALLGFSPTPRADKAWKEFRTAPKAGQPASDIDVAIIDASLFDRLDQEVRGWEARQPAPALQTSRASEEFLDRRRLRGQGCVYDAQLPHGVCQGHLDIVEAFDTTPFLERQHGVSCFVIRDWWCARLRWERDLQELTEKVRLKRVAHPADL